VNENIVRIVQKYHKAVWRNKSFLWSDKS